MPNRMLTDKVVESDEFLELSATAQNLYLHLNLHADDRGFVANPRTVMRICGATAGDAKALIDAKFILGFEGKSAIVIKHWRLHNAIREDRLKETVFLELMSCLYIDENGSYSQNPDHAGSPAIDLCGELTSNRGEPRRIADKCPPKLSKDKLSKVKSIEGKEGEESVRGTSALPSEEWDPDNPYRDTLAMCEKIRQKREAYLNG